MTYEMSVEPENEEDFLTKLMGGGLYFPAKYRLELQDHVVIEWNSSLGNRQRVHCMVVGRCFEGKETTASRVKLQALKGQHNLIRDLLDAL